jgi:hypothetical protein
MLVAILVVSVHGFSSSATLRAGEPVQGELLPPSSYGPSYIETMQDALERDRIAPPPENSKERGNRGGDWVVPTLGATSWSLSGRHYVVNEWGDTRMGIGFSQPVDVHGAYFAGQADPAVWTTGVQVIGYRNGVVVGRTEWFRQIGAEPKWFAMNLRGVDRLEIAAEAVLNGAGWYGMDDLTYSIAAGGGEKENPRIVVNFDDLTYKHKISGTGYAGLIWETGRGDFSKGDSISAPRTFPRASAVPVPDGEPIPSMPLNLGTPPDLVTSFQGVIRGDATSMSYPPDTDGAIGPNHYVETVNRNFAVYDKATGAELINILLGSFLPGSNGDPRVLFDQYSQRWVVIVTDFSAGARIYLAVSLTSDPTGSWFKTDFLTAQGPDAGKWPDYPTLGVNENGIYTAAYMVGGFSGMTIFGIKKSPLLANPPTLGSIYAFRSLPWEGAIQPVHSYGPVSGEYLVSVESSTKIRVRRMTSVFEPWSLSELGSVTVPFFSSPPNAPAQGSSVPLNTIDDRLMMSVYRDGSIWTCHTISHNGKAACRWYEIDAASVTLVQSGTVADSSLYYFFPSIMVNSAGNAVMGFTGSNALQYAACYFTGRLAGDPLGEMAPPVLYKPGTGPQNNIDGFGRNRWGDYSYTTLDPTDELTLWTLQEYGHASNIWGTYVGVLSFDNVDCNANGILDTIDISSGTSLDCNATTVPDECEPIAQGDFNGDGSVDLDDYLGFADCVAGPELSPSPSQAECVQTCLEAFDFDGDGDVDLQDYSGFQNAFNG